jgi:hypothetical protein
MEFSLSEKSINTIVSNGKRFIAYELVKRLQEERKNEILEKLAAAVYPTGQPPLAHKFNRI